MPGDHLDLTSDPGFAVEQEPTTATSQLSNTRKFVGIHFVCCDIYSRVYINRAATAYAGFCPRCSKKIELKIGPGGSNSRFYSAG